MIRLRAGRWEKTRFARAVTFSDRLLGVKHRAGGNGVMMATRSVHSFWGGGIDVVFLDARHRVLSWEHLPSRRIAWHRGAHFVLELPPGGPLPDVGVEIEVIRGG